MSTMAQWDHYSDAVSTPSLQTDLFLLFLSLLFEPSLFHSFFFFLFLIFTFSLHLYLSRPFIPATFSLRSQSKESFCRRLCPVGDDAALTGVFVGLRTLAGQGTGPSTMARPAKISGIQRPLCVRRGLFQSCRRSTILALHSSDNVDKFRDTGLQLTDLLRCRQSA